MRGSFADNAGSHGNIRQKGPVNDAHESENAQPLLPWKRRLFVLHQTHCAQYGEPDMYVVNAVDASLGHPSSYHPARLIFA